MKKILFILPLILFFSEIQAQGWLTEENNMETNWNVTLQLGSSLLLGEMKKDFSGFNNNTSNTPGLGVSLQLSKMVWERVDIAAEIGLMSLNGANNNSSTIHYLMQSGNFNKGNLRFLPYPVNFHSNVFSFAVSTKYNFINFSSYLRSFIKLNLFIRLGIGTSYLASEMGYTEPGNYQLSGLSDPLFSTSRDLIFTERFHGFFLSAVGVNYQASERIFISGEMNFMIINSGLSDGIYNTNEQLPAEISGPVPNEFQIPVFGFAGKFSIGATYFFNFDTRRKTRQNAYPWYENRYRSYFSKYHAPASKRIIKERIPFYNNKFDE
jgi:hypothetical protein